MIVATFNGFRLATIEILGAINIPYYEEMARANSSQHCSNSYDGAERFCAKTNTTISLPHKQI
jgi:hypothetical protein